MPPAPKAESAVKNPHAGRLGLAPDTIVASEVISKVTLNAIFLPMISAPKPQKIAPMSSPTYSETVPAFRYVDGDASSRNAPVFVTDWTSAMSESTA